MSGILGIPEIIDAKKKLDIAEEEYMAKLKIYNDEHSREQNIKRKCLKKLQKELKISVNTFEKEKSHKERHDKISEIYSEIDRYNIQLNDLKNIENSVLQTIEKSHVKTIDHLSKYAKNGKLVIKINDYNINEMIKGYNKNYESLIQEAKMLENKPSLTIEQLNNMENDIKNLFDKINKICNGLDPQICENCKCGKSYDKWGDPTSHTENSGSWATERYWCRKKE